MDPLQALCASNSSDSDDDDDIYQFKKETKVKKEVEEIPRAVVKAEITEVYHQPKRRKLDKILKKESDNDSAAQEGEILAKDIATHLQSIKEEHSNESKEVWQQQKMVEIAKDAKRTSKSSKMKIKSEKRREALKKIIKDEKQVDIETNRRVIQKATVLDKMENYNTLHGPLKVLHDCMRYGFKAKVWVRRYKGLRGIITGYIVAFDLHMNLAMMDVNELYTIETWMIGEPIPKSKKKKKKKKKNGSMHEDDSEKAIAPLQKENDLIQKVKIPIQIEEVVTENNMRDEDVAIRKENIVIKKEINPEQQEGTSSQKLLPSIGFPGKIRTKTSSSTKEYLKKLTHDLKRKSTPIVKKEEPLDIETEKNSTCTVQKSASFLAPDLLALIRNLKSGKSVEDDVVSKTEEPGIEPIKHVVQAQSVKEVAVPRFPKGILPTPTLNVQPRPQQSSILTPLLGATILSQALRNVISPKQPNISESFPVLASQVFVPRQILPQPPVQVLQTPAINVALLTRITANAQRTITQLPPNPLSIPTRDLSSLPKDLPLPPPMVPPPPPPPRTLLLPPKVTPSTDMPALKSVAGYQRMADTQTEMLSKPSGSTHLQDTIREKGTGADNLIADPRLRRKSSTDSDMLPSVISPAFHSGGHSELGIIYFKSHGVTKDGSRVISEKTSICKEISKVKPLQQKEPPRGVRKVTASPKKKRTTEIKTPKKKPLTPKKKTKRKEKEDIVFDLFDLNDIIVDSSGEADEEVESEGVEMIKTKFELLPKSSEVTAASNVYIKVEQIKDKMKLETKKEDETMMLLSDYSTKSFNPKIEKEGYESIKQSKSDNVMNDSAAKNADSKLIEELENSETKLSLTIPSQIQAESRNVSSDMFSPVFTEPQKNTCSNESTKSKKTRKKCAKKLTSKAIEQILSSMHKDKNQTTKAECKVNKDESIGTHSENKSMTVSSTSKDVVPENKFEKISTVSNEQNSAGHCSASYHDKTSVEQIVTNSTDAGKDAPSNIDAPTHVAYTVVSAQTENTVNSTVEYLTETASTYAVTSKQIKQEKFDELYGDIDINSVNNVATMIDAGLIDIENTRGHLSANNDQVESAGDVASTNIKETGPLYDTVSQKMNTVDHEIGSGACIVDKDQRESMEDFTAENVTETESTCENVTETESKYNLISKQINQEEFDELYGDIDTENLNNVDTIKEGDKSTVTESKDGSNIDFEQDEMWDAAVLSSGGSKPAAVQSKKLNYRKTNMDAAKIKLYDESKTENVGKTYTESDVPFAPIKIKQEPIDWDNYNHALSDHSSSTATATVDNSKRVGLCTILEDKVLEKNTQNSCKFIFYSIAKRLNDIKMKRPLPRIESKILKSSVYKITPLFEVSRMKGELSSTDDDSRDSVVANNRLSTHVVTEPKFSLSSALSEAVSGSSAVPNKDLKETKKEKKQKKKKEKKKKKKKKDTIERDEVVKIKAEEIKKPAKKYVPPSMRGGIAVSVLQDIEAIRKYKERWEKPDEEKATPPVCDDYKEWKEKRENARKAKGTEESIKTEPWKSEKKKERKNSLSENDQRRRSRKHSHERHGTYSKDRSDGHNEKDRRSREKSPEKFVDTYEEYLEERHDRYKGSNTDSRENPLEKHRDSLEEKQEVRFALKESKQHSTGKSNTMKTHKHGTSTETNRKEIIRRVAERKNDARTEVVLYKNDNSTETYFSAQCSHKNERTEVATNIKTAGELTGVSDDDDIKGQDQLFIQESNTKKETSSIDNEINSELAHVVSHKKDCVKMSKLVAMTEASISESASLTNLQSPVSQAYTNVTEDTIFCANIAVPNEVSDLNGVCAMDVDLGIAATTIERTIDTEISGGSREILNDNIQQDLHSVEGRKLTQNEEINLLQSIITEQISSDDEEITAKEEVTDKVVEDSSKTLKNESIHQDGDRLVADAFCSKTVISEMRTITTEMQEKIDGKGKQSDDSGEFLLAVSTAFSHEQTKDKGKKHDSTEEDMQHDSKIISTKNDLSIASPGENNMYSLLGTISDISMEDDSSVVDDEEEQEKISEETQTYNISRKTEKHEQDTDDAGGKNNASCSIEKQEKYAKATTMENKGINAEHKFQQEKEERSKLVKHLTKISSEKKEKKLYTGTITVSQNEGNLKERTRAVAFYATLQDKAKTEVDQEEKNKASDVTAVLNKEKTTEKQNDASPEEPSVKGSAINAKGSKVHQEEKESNFEKIVTEDISDDDEISEEEGPRLSDKTVAMSIVRDQDIKDDKNENVSTNKNEDKNNVGKKDDDVEDDKEKAEIEDKTEQSKITKGKDNGEIEDDKEEGEIEDNKEEGEIEDNKEEGEIEDDKEEGDIEDNKEEGEIEGDKEEGDIEDTKEEGEIDDEKEDGEIGDGKEEGEISDDEGIEETGVKKQDRSKNKKREHRSSRREKKESHRHSEKADKHGSRRSQSSKSKEKSKRGKRTAHVNDGKEGKKESKRKDCKSLREKNQDTTAGLDIDAIRKYEEKWGSAGKATTGEVKSNVRSRKVEADVCSRKVEADVWSRKDETDVSFREVSPEIENVSDIESENDATSNISDEYTDTSKLNIFQQRDRAKAKSLRVKRTAHGSKKVIVKKEVEDGEIVEKVKKKTTSPGLPKIKSERLKNEFKEDTFYTRRLQRRLEKEKELERLQAQRDLERDEKMLQAVKPITVQPSKPAKGKFFQQRHVNQIFIRGDNIVMIAYEKPEELEKMKREDMKKEDKN